MNSNVNWALQADHVVYKFLKRVPRKDAERLLHVIEHDVPKDPFAGDIQKIGGEENAWRRRIGSYRIKFEIIQAERVIHVFRVDRRTSSTY